MIKFLLEGPPLHSKQKNEWYHPQQNDKLDIITI